MLPARKVLLQLYERVDDIIAQNEEGKIAYDLLLKQHPADIADLLTKISAKKQQILITQMPEPIASQVLEKMHSHRAVPLLLKLPDEVVAGVLKHMHLDGLTELFENFSDKDLQKYLKLLQKKQRQVIVSHLNFEPKTAGRLMNSEVLSLQQDFTIKKSMELIQRVKPQRDILRRLYVTDNQNVLVGYIMLDELVLNKPEVLLKKILRKNVLVFDPHEDQEEVARKIHHYGLVSAPVTDINGHFMGVVTADDVFDVLEEEATEDVYKMSGLVPIEHHYFQTSIWESLRQRFLWLAGLLLLQSISSFIVERYYYIIQKHIIVSFFITMLIGTGGNAGNQSATVVIRGLATGEIKRKQALVVLLREFSVGIFLSILLSIISFVRVYLTYRDFVSALAISFALLLIVVTSIILGTMIPLLLERLNIDPAHSAAPFLATLMDIFGILIYCLVCSYVFSW